MVRTGLRDLDEASPGAQQNHVPLRFAPFTGALRAQISAQPDAKLRELWS